MYAEFWKKTSTGEIMPCVGSDSVLWFDGRWSFTHCIAEARAVCVKRGLYGFSFQSGPMNRPSDRLIRSMERVV